MAKSGDELVNPVTGLRTVFRKTAQETSGELLQVDWIGEPGWTTGPDHVHPRQEERFEVLFGKLGLAVGWVSWDGLRGGSQTRTLDSNGVLQPCCNRCRTHPNVAEERTCRKQRKPHRQAGCFNKVEPTRKVLT